MALTMVTCGSEDDDDDTGWDPYPASGSVGTGGVPQGGGTGGDATGGDLNAPAALCTTHTISDAAAPSKTKAAFCFGMFYTETFSCSHNNGTDYTTCTGGLSQYVVPWSGANSATVSNTADGTALGTASLLPDGTVALTWAGGTTGTCRIDSATLELCTVAPH